MKHLISIRCSGLCSYKMLEQVEIVCRHARQNDNPFGKMQVIVSGDFFQLPPVPNSLYKDAGDFAFRYM
jgi:hypothetical protein